MREFFIVAHSFAAPFVGDQSTHFVTAETPTDALLKLAAEYSHPCGLYSANCYLNADGYHKNEKPLAQWLCNHAQAIERATRGQSAYTLRSHGPGSFTVLTGKVEHVENPRAGSIVTVSAAPERR